MKNLKFTLLLIISIIFISGCRDFPDLRGKIVPEFSWMLRDNWTPVTTEFSEHFDDVVWTGDNPLDTLGRWRRTYWPTMGVEMGVSRAIIEDNRLKLTVPANRLQGGEVATMEQKFFYGLYEASLKCTPVSGVCNAFFITAWDDDLNLSFQEIDIEFLTPEFDTGTGSVYFSLHPHKGLPDAFWQKRLELNFNPSDAFHKYGIEVLETGVNYYIDDTLVWQFFASVGSMKPEYPSRIMFNNWTGNDNWGGGPPESDAVMEIEWVRFSPSESNYSFPTPAKTPTP